MFRQIGELESIGDACYKIARTIKHLRENREDLTPKQYRRLQDMQLLVNEALSQMMVVLNGRRNQLSIDASKDIENDINALRDSIKAENILDINDHHNNYNIGTLYTDLASEYEKLGDYVMNVVEARLGKRHLTFRGLQVNIDRKTVFVDGTPIDLTRTEFGLLCELLSAHGQVHSRQQLIDTVWNGTIVTDRTVDVHITRLRRKLGPYAENIANRPGFGYYFQFKSI